MLPLPPNQAPRAWQLQALDALRAGLGQHQSVICSAATGTGKGSLIAGLAVLSAQRGNRVLLLAHREELVVELEQRIRKVVGAPSVGVVQGPRDEWLNPIVAASVASVTPKRRERMGTFNLVLVDECHHATAPSYRRIFDAVAESCPKWKNIGFTATPFRTGKDGGTSGLGAVYQAVVFEYGIADAIQTGDLVPLRAFRVETQLDISAVKVGIDGDFDAGDLGRLIDTPARNGLVVEQYLHYGVGRPGLVFAATVEHAQHIAEAFKLAGVNAEAVWGDMPKDRRRFLVQAFRDHPEHLPVLVSRDLLFEGFDAPKVETVIQARPTKSPLIFTQMVGRGLRTSPKKTECILVDVVDGGTNLGLITAADLTDAGAQEGAKRRELQVGDRVARRHHDEWGLGVVVEFHGDERLRSADVEWPPSKVHAHGSTSRHPLPELRYVADEDAGGEQLVIAPGIASVRSYEVFLLPGSRGPSRVGWYDYNGAWSAGGDLADGRRISMLVRNGAAKGRGESWEVWARLTEPTSADGRRSDATTRLHESAGRDLALAWADAHLKSLKTKVARVDADWKTQPSSEGQRAALAKWGVKRDLSQVSKGECSAMLDAIVTLRRIREVEDPRAAERARVWRERHRNEQQMQGGAA